MEFGKVHCGGCKKTIGLFPVDNAPKDKQLELYCEGCAENLEDESDLKEDTNGQN